MTKLLEGKVAVITGAGRGIGKATAFLFAKEGAKLLLSDIDMEPLNEVALEIKKIGGEVIASVCDVRNENNCEKIMNEAASKLGNGSIDILANIAGITRDRVIHKMSLEDWNFIIDVNLTGTFNCIKSVSPYMRDVAKNEEEKTGKIKDRSIINISSISAKGNVGQANYAASKAGIEGLTKAVAKEWARFNIRCNAIAPGYIETRLTQVRKEGESFGLPEKQRELVMQMQRESGLNREGGKPEDIANAILFFASPLSSFVTGQVLTVAGGLLGTI